jgi:hypothetical protein
VINGGEKSLRELFYLEYKKTLDGQANPIVYSRFGKQSYDSEEKFKPEEVKCLVRTCNIKKLLKNQLGDTKKEMVDKIEANNRMRRGSSFAFGNGADQEESNAMAKMPFVTPSNLPYYMAKGRQDRTLVFESRFESGNLQLVQKSSDYEYNLVLQSDVNSKGHT